jgi:hypothetical protein
MPKYAYFNKHDGRVLQWIDTDAMNHILPEYSLLHECTVAEWLSRKSGEKMVKSGKIVDYVAPSASFEQLKADKIEEIKTDCHDAIVAGIDHEGYHYPTTETDQINLNGLVTRSRILGAAGEPYKFWCADVDGNWARREHTTEQIQAVGIAVAEHVIFKQDQYEAKLTTINNALTPEALALIAWE